MKLFAGLILGYLAGRKENELRALASRLRSSSNDESIPTRAELYERAQAADIPGRSSMTKDELRKALAAEEEPSLATKIVQTVAEHAPEIPGR